MRVIALMVLFATLTSVAQAAPGAVDTDFGTNGVVATGAGTAPSLRVAEDGTIWVGGTTESGFVVERYSANGEPIGTTTIPQPGGRLGAIVPVADGGAVGVGSVSNPDESGLAVFRLDAAGAITWTSLHSFDPETTTFGEGTHWAFASDAVVIGGDLLVGGSMRLPGSGAERPAIARLDFATGAFEARTTVPDPCQPPMASYARVVALTVLQNGTALAGMSQDDCSGYHPLTTSYEALVTPSLNLTPLDSQDGGISGPFAIDSKRRIIVPVAASHTVATRLTSDGRVDPTFAPPIPPPLGGNWGTALDRQDRVLVLGYKLSRLTSTGVLDTTYRAKKMPDARAIAADGDGLIVARVDPYNGYTTTLTRLQGGTAPARVVIAATKLHGKRLDVTVRCQPFRKACAGTARAAGRTKRYRIRPGKSKTLHLKVGARTKVSLTVGARHREVKAGQRSSGA